MSILKDPAKRAEWIYGQPMKPCPKCKSYNFKHQTPIKMDEPIHSNDSVAQAVGKWARAIKSGNTPLEGPVFMMCFDCGHKGPSVDCTGRTSEDVGRDKAVSDSVKKLWNEQQ
ncbi:MAG: hypothetical protein JWM68_3757 [Verrucomicrobiales bacterium]|nr:hypothetical protein [Verrucomicrobiales bacterium]